MLAKSVVCAAVPVADLDRAQRFYGETLGLLAASMGDPDEAFYLAGGQTMLHRYESPSHSAATGRTVATFLVENLGFREASALVQTRGAQGNAHAFAGPLLLAAAIPLSAASPAFHQLEIPPHGNTLYNLVRPVPAPEGGMISALAGPGLGVEVDEDAVRAAAC